MDHKNDSDPTCPFCPFSDPGISRVVEHVNVYHPEVDTQAEHSRRPANAPSTGTGEFLGNYAECPHGCGEIVLSTELPAHLDLHFAETVALEDISPHQPGLLLDLETTVSSHDAKRRGQLEEDTPGLLPCEDRAPSSWPWIDGTKTPHNGRAKRLGRTELGPHAHEKQMPSWLRRMLEKGSRSIFTNTIAIDGTLRKREAVENETRDIIPVLARLCEQDKSVQRAFFCSPKVHQISKIPKEGGFCGYRNIQMLITYMKETQIPGHERFPGELPTIFQLQDMIEDAWDKGFNSVGRIETGGIRGTRKYIGTPEAQALFSSLGIQ
ncbi:hypothetical protein AbraIFM66950_008412 [Aspergillus brasiliensis]|nr:hypothetical protein AbraIFM66950_008412 [Aspergillus brasiliensis]